MDLSGNDWSGWDLTTKQIIGKKRWFGFYFWQDLDHQGDQGGLGRLSQASDLEVDRAAFDAWWPKRIAPDCKMNLGLRKDIYTTALL